MCGRQGPQVALGTAARKILEHVAARIHDGDDHSRQRFTESKRCRHRDKRNGVDTDPAHSQIPQNGNCQRDHDRNGGCRPDVACHTRLPGKVANAAGDKARQSKSKKRSPICRFIHTKSHEAVRPEWFQSLIASARDC